jgi:hypothetical protein
MSLSIGIVGMGNIGNIHAGVYRDLESTEIVAVCDILKDRADKAADEYGAKVFYSVPEMLESGIRLDACSMATAGIENGGDHYSRSSSARDTCPGQTDFQQPRSARKWWRWRKEKIPYGLTNHRFTPPRPCEKWIERSSRQLHLVNMRMWINNPTKLPWMRALHPIDRCHVTSAAT